MIGSHEFFPLADGRRCSQCGGRHTAEDIVKVGVTLVSNFARAVFGSKGRKTKSAKPLPLDGEGGVLYAYEVQGVSHSTVFGEGPKVIAHFAGDLTRTFDANEPLPDGWYVRP